jgi:hypothetical protein
VWISADVQGQQDEHCRRAGEPRAADAGVRPGVVGWFLHRTVDLPRPGDFQPLCSWHRETIWLIGWIARKVDTVVVPISVLRPPYLDELLDGLRSYGHTVHHVLLNAPADVVRARIAADEVDRSAALWRADHITAYEAAKTDLAICGFHHRHEHKECSGRRSNARASAEPGRQ